jgi:polyhydroxyalkanoate synthesis regulator phasin
MNEQRKDILDMLAEGKITAEEAERLIAALERDQPSAASSLDARPKGKAKYLRVVVDNVENGEPGRVNVRVPLQLLRAGVRLAALIPPQALGQANAELNKSGVPFDLTQLKPEQLEALVEHLDDLTVEVDQPDAKVRVFCE